MTFVRSIARVALATALLLLVPLGAMQLSQEVAWSLGDFVAAGVLLFGAGLAFVLLARVGSSGTYRLAAGVAVAAGLLLGWANAAVGLVGSEDNPANLLYAAVPTVALVGALAARFRPLGMSRAMFAAALAYVLVTAVALAGWGPAGAAAGSLAPTPNVLGANGALAALWAVSGLLFRRAAAGAASFRRLA